MVLNELREEYEQEPYGRMWLERPEFIFSKQHPYGHPVIGTSKTVQQATIKSIRQFARQQYCANNALMMISGNFDPQQATEQTDDHVYGERIPVYGESHISYM